MTTTGAVSTSEVGDGAAVPRPGLGWLVALMVANTVAAVGLFGDIARHVSLVAVLTGDDFLSGWHLVLYGGVTGVAVVLGLMALRFGPRAPLERLGAACAGLAVLTVGGVTDAVWHELFGVEAALQALVSPPHLLILLGLVLLMVAPIAALAEGPDRPLDRPRSAILALSVTSLLLVVSLFTGYLTPLIGGQQFQAGAYVEPIIGTSLLDYDTTRSLGVALWFSAAVSLLVVVVRGRTAPVGGTWTLAFGLLATAPLVATGSEALPISAALVTYGILSDLTGTRRRPHPLGTGLATASLWAVLFAILAAQGDLVWIRELWAGVIMTGGLTGAGVGAAVRWVSAPPRPAAF